MAVKKVSDIDEYNQLVENTEHLIVKFEADWCGPCKAVAPVIEEESTKNPGTGFIAVDIEEDGFEPVLSELGVRSVPTVVRFNKGEKVSEIVGSFTRAYFRDFLKKD